MGLEPLESVGQAGPAEKNPEEKKQNWILRKTLLSIVKHMVFAQFDGQNLEKHM